VEGQVEEKMDANSLALGMSGALRTGNHFIDMVMTSLLLMFVPILLNASMAYVKDLIYYMQRLMRGRVLAESTRDMSFIETRGFDHPNDFIVNALLLKITDEMDDKNADGTNDYYRRCKLTTVHKHCVRNSALNETQNMMRQLSVIKTPCEGEFLRVRDNIYYKYYSKETRTASPGSSNNSTQFERSVTMVLRCTGPNSTAILDRFIDEAVQAQKEVRISKSLTRQEVLMLNQYTDKMDFSVYPLDCSKGFESVFFERKQELIGLIDAFREKSGRFGNPGCPHRLGVLMCGPPGTGKTSIIRAMASYLKRSVMFIDLAKVRTNMDLMTMMFGTSFMNRQTNNPTYVAPGNMIYVFEDIDASSEVVLQRTANATQDEDAGRRRKKRTEPSLRHALEDRLTLSGILNCIDGVVDVPGRIVIMTSNHPERLDPALIRPGRVTLNIYLGYVTVAIATDLVKSLMSIDLRCASNATMSQRFNAEFQRHSLDTWCSPAAFESMCICSESFDQLLDAFAVDA
jgi:chaperone BCS1